jgi:hypothetical protein
MDHRRFALIRATRTPAGFVLMYTDDSPAEKDRKPYATETAALESAAQLWPSDSKWQGIRIADGWRVTTRGA